MSNIFRYDNIKDNIIKDNIIKDIMDLMYLCILGLYVARSVLNKTMFKLTWPEQYMDYLHFAMIMFLVIKIIIYDFKNKKRILFDVLYLIMFYFVYKSTGYVFLLEYGCFVLTAKEIAYQRILRFYFIIVSSIMAITIFGALVGCIQDLIYIGNGNFKHAFGFVYTTNFAAQILFLTITYLGWKGRVPTYLFNIFLIFLAYTLFQYTGARNSTLCMILLVPGGVYIKYSDNEIKKTIERQNKIKLKLISIIDACLIMSFPIAAFISLGLTFLFTNDSAIMNKINEITSGRLVLGKNALVKYGISLWGSPFKMIGIARNYVSRIDYNFVDSSYVMILVRYGVVLFLVTIVGFVYMAVKAKKVQNRYMLILLAIVSLQSMVEHHLLEVFFNSLVLIILSDLNTSKYYSTNVISSERRMKIVSYFISLTLVVCLIIFHSQLLSYARTLVTLLRLNEPGRNIYFILGVLSAGIVCIFTVFMVYNVYNAIKQKKTHQYVILFIIGSLVGVMFLSIQFIVCNTILNNKSAQYKEGIQKNIYTIERLEKIKDYNLYVDDLPYLYTKYSKINKKIIPGTPYKIDLKKNVVITKATNELLNLLKVGYLCGQLSDTEYIYTNDEMIAKILRESGIEMNDFYSLRQYIDLKKLAKKNKLAVDADNGIFITGNEKSITKGLGITIYGGILRVNYELELLATNISEGEVAKIKVTSYNGKELIKEMSVNKSDFDEKGYYTATLDCTIADSVGVDFLVIANDDTKLKLKSLTYEKIGKN